MTITESQRFDLHAKLKSTLGDDMGTLLMEHLPPSGWSDVARKSDLDALEQRIALRFEKVDTQFAGVNTRFTSIDQQFDNINTRFTSIDQRFAKIIPQLEKFEHLFAMVDRQFEMVDQQLKSLRATLHLLVGTVVAFNSAILVMLVQLKMKG